jgi:hypothetical protein
MSKRGKPERTSLTFEAVQAEIEEQMIPPGELTGILVPMP